MAAILYLCLPLAFVAILSALLYGETLLSSFQSPLSRAIPDIPLPLLSTLPTLPPICPPSQETNSQGRTTPCYPPECLAATGYTLPRCKGCASFTTLEVSAFNATHAPFLTTPHCPLYAHSKATVAQCLEGRRIYVVGNSIGRGFMFQLGAMMGGGGGEEGGGDETTGGSGDPLLPNRTQQKLLCAREKYASDEPCPLFPPSTTPGKPPAEGFWWMQQLFDENMAQMPPDPCIESGKFAGRGECMAHVFKDSKPGDVLLFYLGLHYALHQGDMGVGLAAKGLTFEQFFNTSLHAWKGHLAGGWKGRGEDIFRVRLANIKERAGDGRQSTAIGAIPGLNRMMDEVFSETPWSVVDQWGINHGRERFYNDHVHFSGPLSEATWHVILSSLCGSGRGGGGSGGVEAN